MIIALLAVLGVDLIVIVVLLGAVLARRRWLSHQTGAIKGAIRVVEGEISGLEGKWKRGYGRWVRDVLVWTKAPSLFRNELAAIDGLAGAVRLAEPDGVKRLGSQTRDRAAGSRGWRADRGRRCRGGLRAGTRAVGDLCAATFGATARAAA